MQHFLKHLRFWALGVLVVSNVLIWSAALEHEGSGLLTVAFLDVGQGDAIFIEAPNRTQVLVDGGSGSRVLAELSELMPFYDRSIDVLVATHPDKDHVGGLVEVLSRYDVDTILRSGAVSDTGVYQALNAAIASRGVTEVQAIRGMRIMLSPEVYLEVLFPDRDASGLTSNEASVVGRLVYDETEFLLTGDSPKKIEEYLVSIDGGRLRSDVLKVGHHGSNTSTSGRFLSAVLPSFAVISAGKDNRYGHPHEEVVSALRDIGAEVDETSNDGTVVFLSDGNRLWQR